MDLSEVISKSLIIINYSFGSVILRRLLIFIKAQVVEFGRHAWLRAMWEYPVRVQVPPWADKITGSIMGRSIKTLVFLGIIFFGLSCSTYSIKNDIEHSSILSKIKNAGIIFRISNGSKITEEELTGNFSSWLSVYQKKGNIAVIRDAGNALTVFNNPQQRFYQVSNEDEYLKFKSIGVVNQYLQKNQYELLNIISRNNLDSIIIYEIYSVISTQMQFFEYESVLAIADADLNIGYLDHQSDYYESTSSLIDDLKNQAMDKINDRLIHNLRDIKLLGSKTEGEKKVLNKDIGKTKPQTGEKPAAKQEEKKSDKPAEKTDGTPHVKEIEKPAEKTADKSAEKKVERPKELSPSIDKTPVKQ